jgi:hypothetical protein
LCVQRGAGKAAGGFQVGGGDQGEAEILGLHGS